MRCPDCGHIITDGEVVRAAAIINASKNKGKGSRPGAKGLIRSPGRPKKKRAEPMPEELVERLKEWVRLIPS